MERAASASAMASISMAESSWPGPVSGRAGIEGRGLPATSASNRARRTWSALQPRSTASVRIGVMRSGGSRARAASMATSMPAMRSRSARCASAGTASRSSAAGAGAAVMGGVVTVVSWG